MSIRSLMGDFGDKGRKGKANKHSKQNYLNQEQNEQIYENKDSLLPKRFGTVSPGYEFPQIQPLYGIAVEPEEPIVVAEYGVDVDPGPIALYGIEVDPQDPVAVPMYAVAINPEDPVVVPEYAAPIDPEDPVVVPEYAAPVDPEDPVVVPEYAAPVDPVDPGDPVVQPVYGIEPTPEPTGLIDTFEQNLDNAMDSVATAVEGLFFANEKGVEVTAMEPKLETIPADQSKSGTEEGVFTFSRTISNGDRSLKVSLKVTLTNYDKVEEYINAIQGQAVPQQEIPPVQAAEQTQNSGQAQEADQGIIQLADIQNIAKDQKEEE